MTSEEIQEFIDSYSFSPDKVGDIGEAITFHELDWFTFKCRHVYIPKESGFCEIDMVCMSNKGIFVIENKNIHGKVTGSLNDTYWDICYRGYIYEKLYNPIKQNVEHIKYLKNFLGDFDIHSIPLYNIVIFNNLSKLNVRNADDIVFQLKDFKPYYETLPFTNIPNFERIQNLVKSHSNRYNDMKNIHLSMLTS